MRNLLSLVSALALGACASVPRLPPIPCGQPVDHLIFEGEDHFAHLWMLTNGGENAEGYFSFAGDQIAFQYRNGDEGIACNRIYITDRETGARVPVSNGKGITTCAFFLPGDGEVIFASTQGHAQNCPPPVDHSQGYVWMIHPELDLWIHDLATGEERNITSSWGYDAEATVSPMGDRMVFTSTRSGDIELWTCDLDGTNLVQVTDQIGYDGGAFFSHDGTQLVYRTTAFSTQDPDGDRARYRELLQKWTVRPHSMEIWIVNADGTDPHQVTHLGKANFAPYFTPDDSAIVFSSNHHGQDDRTPNFDIFSIGVDGTGLERVTTFQGFDSFPMFSPDGVFLVFASNRGNRQRGETNLFLAEWK
jgi:Tol biopolymer transport system component